MGVVLAAAVWATAGFGGWLPEERLTFREDTTDKTTNNNARALAVDPAGDVHAVWYGGHQGVWQVWYSRHDRTTGEWSEDTVVSDGTGDAVRPAVAADGSGNVHVIWQVGLEANGTGLRYRCRDAVGVWDSVETVAAGLHVERPSIACGGGILAVAWEEQIPGGSKSIFVAVRDSTGWSIPDTASEPGASGNYCASVGVDSRGYIGVLWQNGAGEWMVLFRERSAAGWGDIDTLCRAFHCGLPCLAVTPNGQGYAAWLHNIATGVGDSVSCCRRLDGVWAPPVTLPRPSRWVGPAALGAGDGGAVCAVFAADAGGTVPQAWFTTSADSGATWSPVESLAGPGANCASPGLCRGPGSDIQVAWTDYRNSGAHPDVYFRMFRELRDVGTARVVSPLGMVDSGAAVVPAAGVFNGGDSTERDVPVRFRLEGGELAETVAVLAPGETLTVEFDSVPVRTRGWQVVSCSTGLGDSMPGNDVALDSFFVRVVDAAADSVLGPCGPVSGDTIWPRVVFRNAGNATAGCTCRVRIDEAGAEVYADSLELTLLPDSSRVAEFRPWPGHAGDFALSCSVAVPGDMDPANDTCRVSFTIAEPDVRVESVDWPPAVVDSGTAGQPAARVHNFGGEPAGFAGCFLIDSSYADSVRVDSLAPGSDTVLTFTEWRALVRGRHPVCCSLYDVTDAPGRPLECTVFVRVCDAALRDIVGPTGAIEPGGVAPQVRVANCGNEPGMLPCLLEITGDSGVAYAESVSVVLGPESDSLLCFPEWQAARGGYVVTARTSMPGDMVPGNDTLAAELDVLLVDAAVRSIVSPAACITEGPVVPEVRLVNLGDEPSDLLARFEVRAGAPVFVDSARLDALPPGAETVAVFREWDAAPGSYHLTAAVVTAGDRNPGNDTCHAEVVVESVVGRGWSRRADVPPGPGGRVVGDGGCLAATDSALYCLKAGNTDEWYRYDAGPDSWRALASLPRGPGDRRARRGACLCPGDDGVFGIKGNRTREFFRYLPRHDSWVTLPGLPAAVRPVKWGSGMAFVAGDTDRVLLVKGSGTSELLVYRLQPGDWHARRPVPAGPSGRRPGAGTCFAAAGTRLFCLKGRRNELFEYCPGGDSWVLRPPLPGRRARRGTALAGGVDGRLYVVKGGGSSEFWCYDAGADSWSRLPDIPRGDCRPGLRRGSGLAWLEGRVYAVKGRSREFWCWDPAAAASRPAGRRRNVRGSRAGGSSPRRDRAAGGEVVVYDVLGRCVLRAPRGDGFRLPGLRTRLRAGVYFVAAGGDSATVKLVVLD